MESLEHIVEKMEAPLLFASGNDYGRLPRIRNLGAVITSLAQHLLKELKSKTDPLDDEAGRLSQALLKLFEGYDSRSPQEKKAILIEAAGHVSALKAIVRNPQITPDKGKRSSTRQEGEREAMLKGPLDTLRGVGPRIASLLARKNLGTIEDLLYFLPRRYEDRRTVCRIGETVSGMRATVSGKVILTNVRFLGRRRIFEATIDDGHGALKAKWFKGREAFLRGAFQSGRRVILTGVVGGFPFEREMIHPDFEILDDHDDQLLHFKRIVPVYSETEGLHQKTMRRIFWQVVRDYARMLKNPVPEALCRKHRLREIGEAIRQVHFPDFDQEFDLYQDFRSDAHRTLIYSEFFLFQLAMALRKRGDLLEPGVAFLPGGEMLKRFYGALPFALTAAQKRVIAEIERDMTSTRSMNRLLQGDVGSGKTVVSMAAIVIACENGYQSAMMAPTEILAEQHYRNLRGWSENVGLRIKLLTGSLKNAEKKEFQERLLRGEIDIAIGTHALIQEGVVFKNLGLVVIDEQHRFGVIQRATLRKKGVVPDVLVTTATPIPRTLAMTVYGDLDLSVIDELPPDKKAIRTKVFLETQRTKVYEIIRREVTKGNQVFIVYPLVEESENLDLKDAKRMAEHLQKEIFPEYGVGLIHGRMKGVEKDGVMREFMGKRLQILVSTTVIEVGIDIPEASLMVIEHAERFGLSQLHQLRGRVGRSDIPSYCILMAHHRRSDEAHRRLRIMEETNDGFRIAEEDLALRGPGEFMGTRQAGLPDFRVADIVRDGRILGDAKTDAFALVDDDPRLEKPEHLLLREALLDRWGVRLDLMKTG
ncbi:MAG: ATP-dependent DNA helicase RecG [Deltaproteobacteria bacterium]|nr:ATP-dependent DNA helicase RecG [Deltaproteobacteria bacterium]